jgi:hypothetical protein
MDISDFLKLHETDVFVIISKMGDEFSSHDFIEEFAKRFEAEYIEMLYTRKNSGSAFQTVHSIIAKYLSVNMALFAISKSTKRASENVFGNVDCIQWWIKV